MKRTLFIVCSFCLLASACTQRSICPAFQSAYIYDKDALRKKFSYFQEDSTPKILTASKNKYLIAEAVPYRRKIARISTVEMKDVMPVVPDSLTMDDNISLADLDAAARSVIDSTYIVDVEPQTDSLAEGEEAEYMISKDKEVRVLRYNKDSISYKVEEVRYNVDQDNYMWYLRDAIVLPDIRLLQVQGEAGEETTAKKERKGIRGFFKNLFKKKEEDKEPMDSTDLEPPVERSQYDLDYVEDENAKPAPETKKRGLFKKKEKKEKVNENEEGKVSSGKQRPPKQKKEKKPKQEKPEKIKTEDEKPPDSEVKGEEGF
jgi:hypothetical protein